MNNLKITFGDILADELQNKILLEKFRVVGDKIYNYYAAVEPVIQIPEFMKPKNQRIEEKVRAHLVDLYRAGTLDYWYNKAIEES